MLRETMAGLARKESLSGKMRMTKMCDSKTAFGEKRGH